VDFEKEPENMEQALDMIQLLKDDLKAKEMRIAKLESSLKLFQNTQSVKVLLLK
jgi:hypothetical protein